MNLFDEITVNNKKYIHIVYRMKDRDDIINSYSPDGYEVVSDSFLGYMDRLFSFLPNNRDILFEIQGCDDSGLCEVIEKTIRTTYQLQLAKVEKSLFHSWMRTLWFLVNFVISSILLFNVNDQTNTVIVQYSYLPFWFFGYRILTYPIFDCYPLLKEKKKLKHLIHSVIVFTHGQTITSIPLQHDISETTKDSVVHYLLENGTIVLECNTHSMDEIVENRDLEGQESLLPELSSYLNSVEDFIYVGMPVRLDVDGGPYSSSEQEVISRSIKNDMEFRCMMARLELKKVRNQVLQFCVCLLFAGIILFVWDKLVDKAFHEFLLIIFWFFGDYLIDFILVGLVDQYRQYKKMEHLLNMKIQFKKSGK